MDTLLLLSLSLALPGLNSEIVETVEIVDSDAALRGGVVRGLGLG